MSSKKGGGGLGIERITKWNKIALLKHIWNLCNDSDGSI
jgi:aspartyl/asparaginyl-tRNA synthetase